MFAEYTYRLGPRRMIHELFFDLNFAALYAEAKTILSRDRRNEATPTTVRSMKMSDAERLNYIQMANEQRRRELLQMMGVVGDGVGENCGLERFSPRSPPLSSVKEELASNENLLVMGVGGVQQQQVVTTIKTLDSLNLSYKENKFPIRERNNSK